MDYKLFKVTDATIIAAMEDEKDVSGTAYRTQVEMALRAWLADRARQREVLRDYEARRGQREERGE